MPLILLFSILGSCILSILVVSVIFKTSILELGLVLFESIDKFSYNSLTLKTLNGFNFYLCVYVFILVFTTAMFLGFRYIPSLRRNDKMTYAVLLKNSAIVCFLVLAMTQLTDHFWILKNDLIRYSRLSYEEKVPKPFRKTYQFARDCQAALPGKHTARLVTDLNINKDPDMLTHRYLVYYLYPIDIRVQKASEGDPVIYFDRANALQEILSDHTILVNSKDRHLLTVQKGRAE